MEDGRDFYVIRKSLNILSVLILALAFTNAKIKTLNLLGIEISIDGQKFYIAIFLLYAYFIWRFITKLPFKSGFMNDFDQYYMATVNSKKGIIKTHNFEIYKNRLLEKSEDLKKAFEQNRQLELNHTSIVRTESSAYRRLRISFDLRFTNEISNRQSSLIVNHDFKVSRLFVLKHIFIFCFKHDKFGDYLFPLFLVVANIFLTIFLSGWQGSIKSIFS